LKSKFETLSPVVKPAPIAPTKFDYVAPVNFAPSVPVYLDKMVPNDEKLKQEINNLLP